MRISLRNFEVENVQAALMQGPSTNTNELVAMQTKMLIEVSESTVVK